MNVTTEEVPALDLTLVEIKGSGPISGMLRLAAGIIEMQGADACFDDLSFDQGMEDGKHTYTLKFSFDAKS